jgi:predicted PurR-regulated permease PerM
VLLAALAGAVNAAGAAVFGVPYPVVIFLSIFLLSLIPVIGSLLVYVPPMLIALVFTPLPKPIYYLIWLLITEQLITNVVGPWIGGHRIGIHPLEAMAAAFVGYPLAGVLGSLFAVPLTAFLHVCVQEIYRLRSRRGAPSQSRTEQPPAGLTIQPARPGDST